jgi:hypothetical protein
MSYLRLLLAILREIFDESAYERFCEREGGNEGRMSYSDFVRERERIKNMRCC